MERAPDVSRALYAFFGKESSKGLGRTRRDDKVDKQADRTDPTDDNTDYHG
jgi:hypothetical protein